MQYSLTTTSMIQEKINSQCCFFSVDHITRESGNKLIYGISINTTHYFISKTSGIKDAVQLDLNTPLEADLMNEINTVITEVELSYSKPRSLQRWNTDIFSALVKLRNMRRGPALS